jgi:hypothetical protein
LWAHPFRRLNLLPSGHLLPQSPQDDHNQDEDQDPKQAAEKLGESHSALFPRLISGGDPFKEISMGELIHGLNVDAPIPDPSLPCFQRLAPLLRLGDDVLSFSLHIYGCGDQKEPYA